MSDPAEAIESLSCPAPINARDRILWHGSVGRLSAELLREIFLPLFCNPVLDLLDDQAVFTRLSITQRLQRYSYAGPQSLLLRSVPGSSFLTIPPCSARLFFVTPPLNAPEALRQAECPGYFRCDGPERDVEPLSDEFSVLQDLYSPQMRDLAQINVESLQIGRMTPSKWLHSFATCWERCLQEVGM